MEKLKEIATVLVVIIVAVIFIITILAGFVANYIPACNSGSNLFASPFKDIYCVYNWLFAP